MGISGFAASIEQASRFLRRQPPKPALGLALKPDSRHNLQQFPLVVRQPEEMVQQRQGAIDRGPRGWPLYGRLAIADLPRRRETVSS